MVKRRVMGGYFEEVLGAPALIRALPTVRWTIDFVNFEGKFDLVFSHHQYYNYHDDRKRLNL